MPFPCTLVGACPAHQADAIGAIEGGEIKSFRQNLDPLVDEGRVNPTHRGLWGYTLPGQATQTERSGICVTPAGQMLYAWGDDVSATAGWLWFPAVVWLMRNSAVVGKPAAS